MIQGLSHITLVVRNLEKTAVFLNTIFGAQEVYASAEPSSSLSREKFFLIQDVWLCIMEGEPLEKRTYNHVAFQIAESEFDGYKSKISTFGVDLRPDRPRVKGEGRSLYFYDFDNHLFELHTGTLQDRMEAYLGG